MNRKSYILVRSMLEGDGVLLKKLHGRVPTAYKRSQGNSARFITTEGGRKALSVLVRRFRDDVVEYLQDEDPSVLNKFGDHLVNMHSLLVTMKEKLLDLYPLPPSGNLDKFFTCVRRYTDKLERKMKKKMKKMVAPDEDLEEEKDEEVTTSTPSTLPTKRKKNKNRERKKDEEDVGKKKLETKMKKKLGAEAAVEEDLEEEKKPEHKKNKNQEGKKNEEDVEKKELAAARDDDQQSQPPQKHEQPPDDQQRERHPDTTECVPQIGRWTQQMMMSKPRLHPPPSKITKTSRRENRGTTSYNTRSDRFQFADDLP